MIKSFEMKRTIGELGALDRRELDERNRLVLPIFLATGTVAG